MISSSNCFSDLAVLFDSFGCKFGLFEYACMPMGLTNSGATFQRLMNSILAGLIGVICLIYLDDIIIYSKFIKDHLKHVRLVLERLKKYGIKFNVAKCEIAKEQVKYLGHVITQGQIKPQIEIEKIEKILIGQYQKLESK